MSNDNAVRINGRREISIPFFRVGVPEIDLSAMLKASGVRVK